MNKMHYHFVLEVFSVTLGLFVPCAYADFPTTPSLSDSLPSPEISNPSTIEFDPYAKATSAQRKLEPSLLEQQKLDQGEKSKERVRDEVEMQLERLQGADMNKINAIRDRIRRDSQQSYASNMEILEMNNIIAQRNVYYEPTVIPCQWHSRSRFCKHKEGYTTYTPLYFYP